MDDPVTIRPLRPDDDRSRFSCGNDDLDAYFKTVAGQVLSIGNAGVHVAVAGGEVVGFVVTIASQIFSTELPPGTKRWLPTVVPVLRLGRLGVATAWQGQGVGADLVRHALEQALVVRPVAGCLGVLVEAIPSAVDFYRRYGFEAIEQDSGDGLTRLILPLDTYEKA